MKLFIYFKWFLFLFIIDNQLISYSKGILSIWNYQYLNKIDKLIIDFNDAYLKKTKEGKDKNILFTSY